MASVSTKAMENTNKNIKEKSNKKISIEKKNIIYGLLFASPVILGFIIFVMGPMIGSGYFSLTDYRIASTPKWVGFDNYKNLFTNKDPFFYKSLLVTAFYVFLSVPIQIIVALLVAMVLNRDVKGQGIFRTIFYLPTIVPVAASSMIWIWLMDPDLGLLNNILKVIGLPTSKWIFDEKTVVPSLILMSLWTIGSTVIIFLAGLQGVPKQLYEAVEIDGGNGFHKFINITIPMITPTLFFNLVMGFINGFQVFTEAYIMTSGGPNNASLFYAFYLYKEAFTNFRMGNACALAWILFIIISIFTFIIFRTSKWVYYEGDGQ
ncbi:L-arabinose transport system permease protein AraP [Clostridium puniceum]|uniref:L-arabinose transport system permease protein AraP n=1 Tax=Clostridium puniceum TaxID=29367 RepID=A0A1S8THP5_9CLOT|nr:sugar ABC transporter permease [Clostridium puniceum]OOM77313.1 L-arabinose transport system permease protein AraP [Clostridium puniceum]